MDLLDRRTLLRLLATPALTAPAFSRLLLQASGDGMASRKVKAAPRGKPSGRPFHSRLTDIGKQAGLSAVTVSGHPRRADYVVEAMGCGCALFDFDNDGWLDVLVLSGSRVGDPPADASTRLYQNNRNGTFTDVTSKQASSETAILRRDRRRLQQRWLGRHLHHRLSAERPVPQQRQRHLHRCHAAAGLANQEPRFGSGCTFVDYDRDGSLIFLSPITLPSTTRSFRAPAALKAVTTRTCLLRASRTALWPSFAISQQWRWHFH